MYEEAFSSMMVGLINGNRDFFCNLGCFRVHCLDFDFKRGFSITGDDEFGVEIISGDITYAMMFVEEFNFTGEVRHMNAYLR